MDNKHVTILCSGGIDSTACIHYYKTLKFNVQGVFIDYGQLSVNNELYAVKRISKYFEIPLKIVSVKGLGRMKGGLINGRNLFLTSIALMNLKCQGLIASGIHDGTLYSDCSLSFLESVQKVVDIYFAGAVVVDAPFIKFTKIEIWNYCLENRIPLELTYSCELGESQPCGKCNSCKDLLLLYESTK
jgi:7-cyano-7-deazaguanine synthase